MTGAPFPNGETVTVLTATTDPDPYSASTQDDWDNPTELDVEGCGIEPRPSVEAVQDARNAITNGFTVYMPAGTPVTARNRARVRGTVYSILSEPAVWRSPLTGWEPGIVIQVGRTEG